MYLYRPHSWTYMNKWIPLALVLLACSIMLVPTDECDAERYSVQFHDEFHGDFWMYTDDYGRLSYEQLQNPRLVPTQDGYEFKGWFYPDGTRFAPGMEVYKDTYVVAHYEKIDQDPGPKQYVLYFVLAAIALSCICAVAGFALRR